MTFDCLEKCTTRFFNRIKTILNDGRTKVINDLEGRLPVLLSREKAAAEKAAAEKAAAQKAAAQKEKQDQTATDTDTTTKRKLADTAAGKTYELKFKKRNGKKCGHINNTNSMTCFIFFQTK